MIAAPVVDSSYDRLTATEAACLKNDGVVAFIQCLWTASEYPVAAQGNLQIAQQAGLGIAGYISINRWQRGTYHVERAYNSIDPELWKNLLFVAIDVELNDIFVNDVIQAVDEVQRLGQRPIIYTSYNAWTTKINPPNSKALSDRNILLWNALWDEAPDIDFGRYPFGGWKIEDVIGEQYTGGRNRCGQFVDNNVFDYDRLFQEEHMPTQEYNELKREIANLRQYTINNRNFFASHIIKLNDRVNRLVCIVDHVRATINKHFETHNTGGSIVERAAIPIADALSSIVDVAVTERDALLESLNKLRKDAAEQKKRKEND